jgi:CRP-like cAMP-binding protein
MANVDGDGARSLNRLLDALPAEELARLLRGSERETHPRGEILSEQRKAIRKVYFPISSVLSLVTTLTDGSTIEMSTIGNEGTTAAPVYLGAKSMPTSPVSVRSRASL